MSKTTRASIMKSFDAYVSALIAQSRKVSLMDGLRMFLASETHRMLADDTLKLWYFSPHVLFDMWENEMATGDPRNSFYIRGDEV